MIESTTRVTPLGHIDDAAPRPRPDRIAVWMCERPFLGLLDLRLDPADRAALQAANRILQIELPLVPNRAIEGDGLAALWLGPDEWLVVNDRGAELAVEGRLNDALRGQTFAVTNVTDACTTIELAGRHAGDVLRKGSGLDIHPREFAPDHCAQTTLAKARIILWQRDETPTYYLFVDRSYAEYLWHWLEDAAREFGA
ncbi:MAG: sarcosine oxidase subunit gamma [Proteobacteria bacterium]|nr:sarcosine oxidase subunit gamma [Pseudomonadota bacterium]